MKILKLCAALALGIPCAASAAVTFSQGDLTSVTDVLHTGTVLVANNLGSAAQAVTVNGVSFGTSTSGLGGMTNGGGDFSGEFANGSPLDLLMSGLAFQLGGSSSLTLSGLSSGTDYLLQLFVANSVNSTGKSSRVTVQGSQHNIADFGNSADYIRVSFTASGTTEVISFGNGSDGESARMVLNAYALETANAPIPLPGTLALLGIGGAALALRRRKTA